MSQRDTWTGRTLGTPTIEQWDALQRYAAIHGRYWKQALREDWAQACASVDPDLAGYLQQVRNTFGPRWLSAIDLTQPREGTR